MSNDPNISSSWYRGNIDRPAAEDLLKREALTQISNIKEHQNAFLVRHSKKFESDPTKFSQYVLSVRFYNEKFKHYRIFYHTTALAGYEPSNIGFYIETSQSHPSGFDFIGRPDVLEENLKQGLIELEIGLDENNPNFESDKKSGKINRKPFKCSPIQPPGIITNPSYDKVAKEEYHKMPVDAPETRQTKSIINQKKSTVQIKPQTLEEMRGWLSFSEKSKLSIFKDEKRWYYQLTDHEMQRFTVPPEHNNDKTPNASISLNDILEVVNHPNKKNKFILKVVNRSDQKYTCGDPKNGENVGEERDKWCDAIRQRLKWIRNKGKIINPGNVAVH